MKTWQPILVTMGAVAVAVVLMFGCRKQRRPPPRPAILDATAVPAHRGPAVAAPKPVPQSVAQQAFDRQHRPALRQIIGDLDRLYARSLALQARGVREPATQKRWQTEREQLVSAAGKVRARVLAVDPLGNRSWAAARASVLLRYLTVKLPDAIIESWRNRPSGAFATWKSDFRLIWRRLRRYVENQLKQSSGPPLKDTK